jgi:hypothetical protein
MLIRRRHERSRLHVLLCGSVLCCTVGRRLSFDVAFRILSAIQVRTTLGCRPLSISKIILADAAQYRCEATYTSEWVC